MMMNYILFRSSRFDLDWSSKNQFRSFLGWVSRTLKAMGSTPGFRSRNSWVASYVNGPIYVQPMHSQRQLKLSTPTAKTKLRGFELDRHASLMKDEWQISKSLRVNETEKRDNSIIRQFCRRNWNAGWVAQWFPCVAGRFVSCVDR